MWTNFGRFALVAVAATGLLAVGDQDAQARYRRQYYSTWSYHTTTSYYYRTYYYYPTPVATTYSYHYCIYYPSRPQYVYYYNPVSRAYWGRMEYGADGKPKGYSLLAEKDRKEKLSDIPESAFPAPAAMPAIPGTTDGEKVAAPPADLPKG